MDKHKQPYIRSLVTLRPERFGALIYNRYLGIEAELDGLEAYTARLCTGRHSIEQIEATVGKTFGLPPGVAAVNVGKLLERLEGFFALGLKDGQAEAYCVAPDRLVYPDAGPYYSAPKLVVWDVTYACNLRCPHCLTASGKRRQTELDTAGAKILIDRLAQAQVLTLSLSGGEPFLRPDILDILRYACSKAMRIDIASNGVDISDEIVEALRELPIFQVQISIDGIGEQHDRFRQLPGAFASACRNVQRLLDEGLAVSLSTTATRDNINNLEDIIELALAMGCTGYKAIPFIPAGRGFAGSRRLKLGPPEIRQMCALLDRYAKKLAGQMTVSTETGFACLLGDSLRFPDDGGPDGPMGCSAGYDTLSVGADGTAFPCPGLHEFPLGNVVTEGLPDLWYKSPVLNRLRTIQKHELGKPCRNCRYAPQHCRGGCRAAAYLETGNLLASDPNCFMGRTPAAGKAGLSAQPELGRCLSPGVSPPGLLQ